MSSAKKEAKKITKRVVDALKPGELVWDTDLSGFGVRCQRKDRVYILKTRIGGRQRWFSIGKHGAPWTPDTARDRALVILGQIADRKDPATIRDAEKVNPTLKKAAEWFMAEHVIAKRKSKTAESYQDLLDRIIAPELGETKIDAITRSEVARLHHKQRSTSYQANRALAVLSKLFAWAEKQGYRTATLNPCHGVEKYKEAKRERMLNEDELGRLGKALAAHKGNDYAVAAIRLLVFTGARLGEILTLEWDWVDFERGEARLPDSKTGAKTLHLPPPAMAVLAELPRGEGNPYVIVGSVKGACLVNLQKPWQSIRKAAKLEDVRLHDLRHAFASVAASSGMGLPIIGKLLGHTQAQTTARYAHLASDPVKAAAAKVAGKIEAAMSEKPKADVVPLRKA
jgi:integrase